MDKNIYIIQGEVNTVVGAIKRSARWSTHTHLVSYWGVGEVMLKSICKMIFPRTIKHVAGTEIFHCCISPFKRGHLHVPIYYCEFSAVLIGILLTKWFEG